MAKEKEKPLTREDLLGGIHMKESIESIIEQFVDYLLPELTPYESSLYLYLFRNSFVRNKTAEVRVGKRTIAAGYGKGSRGDITNYAHVSKILQILEKKGCIKVCVTDNMTFFFTIALSEWQF